MLKESHNLLHYSYIYDTRYNAVYEKSNITRIPYSGLFLRVKFLRIGLIQSFKAGKFHVSSRAFNVSSELLVNILRVKFS